MQYKIELKKKEFKILNAESNEVLVFAKYHYTSKPRCAMQINNATYHIEAKTIWENVLAIYTNGKEVGEIEIGFTGNYTLKIDNEEMMTKYFTLSIDYGWKETKLLLNPKSAVRLSCQTKWQFS